MPAKKIVQLTIKEAIPRVTPMGYEFTIRTLTADFKASGIEVVDRRGNTFHDANIYNNVYHNITELVSRGELVKVGPSHEGRYKRVKASPQPPKVDVPPSVKRKAAARPQRVDVLTDRLPYAGVDADLLESAKRELRNRMWQEERRQIRAALTATKFATQHEIRAARPATIETEIVDLMRHEAQSAGEAPKSEPSEGSALATVEALQKTEPPTVRLHVTPRGTAGIPLEEQDVDIANNN